MLDEMQRQRNRKQLMEYRLLDDDFMTAVFDSAACTELLLRIILEKNDIQVLEVKTQELKKNLQGRSVVLDIFAVDSHGKYYNIEVQRNDKGAHNKRARYNSSLLDASIAEVGSGYEKLPESYVIFITERDIQGGGLPIYHIERVNMEMQRPFGDEQHIIYVNSLIQDETALGRLMHDFWCTRADEMYYDVLAERVRHFKEEKGGERTMSKIMEERIKLEKFEDRLDLIGLLMKKMQLSAIQVLDVLEIPKEEQREYLEKLNK